MPQPYAPRVAIITGAAQGIGLSIAQQLAREGIDVALNDIPSKSLQINEAVDAIKATGRKAIAVPADVTSEEQVQAMVETTARELGSVDIVRFFNLTLHLSSIMMLTSSTTITDNFVTRPRWSQTRVSGGHLASSRVSFCYYLRSPVKKSNLKDCLPLCC